MKDIFVNQKASGNSKKQKTTVLFRGLIAVIFFALVATSCSSRLALSTSDISDKTASMTEAEKGKVESPLTDEYSEKNRKKVTKTIQKAKGEYSVDGR